MDPHIQFTTEETRADRSIPFLDTLLMPQPDSCLITTVYKRPTHTDLYLKWDSPHNLAARFSVIVINTLTHRAKTICSNPQLLKEEEDYPKQPLQKYKYHVWALNRTNMKSNRSIKGSDNIRNNPASNNNKPHRDTPYIKELGEAAKTSTGNMAFRYTLGEAKPS